MSSYPIVCEPTPDLLRFCPDHLSIVTSTSGVLERVNVVGVVAGVLHLLVPGDDATSHSLHQLDHVE